MNPSKLLALKNAWSVFTRNHPKFPKFVDAVRKNALQEGTIIEMNVTMPDGKTLTSNLKLTASDIDLMNELANRK